MRGRPRRRAERRRPRADVQPASLPRTRPHTIASRPAAERARPGRSSRPFEPCVSWSLPQRERDQHEPEGNVEPEDPLPGDALHDRAADERAERDGQAADAAPGAERDTAAIRRHRGREDRQRERQHDRAAEPLDRAGRDQLVRRPGERGQGRAAGEDRKADREEPPAAEAVAERGAGEEQDGEGEGVGVHHPLEPGQARVEVMTDHGQCGRHDEVVERRHEERDRGDCEGPEHPGPVARMSAPCLHFRLLLEGSRVRAQARTQAATPK